MWAVLLRCWLVTVAAFSGCWQVTVHKDYEACEQWYPAGETRDAALDIVFLHGLQVGDGSNAREKTWTNKDGINWPKQWLPEELKLEGRSVRILGINYNAQASGYYTGQFRVRAQGHLRIAQNLFQNLVDSNRFDVGGRPFVLLGHSYGGIVIKSLLVYCKDMASDDSNPRAMEAAKRFMENFKGYVFYGVPQQGSELARYLQMGACNPLCVGPSVTKDLVPGTAEMAQLARDFTNAIPEETRLKFAFGETVPYTRCGVSFMVVPPESARGDLPHSRFMELQGKDHSTIVKPNTKNSEVFRKTVEILQDLISSLPGIETYIPTGFNPHTTDAEKFVTSVKPISDDVSGS